MKKLVSLIMVCVLMFCCSMTTFAEETVPVLTLEANEYNSNGERHIKVKWTGSDGTYQVQIDDNEEFESPTTKKKSCRQTGTWSFVLDKEDDSTYYIRVKRGTSGTWSNVVIADMDEPIESESTPYFTFPTIPKVPDISNSIKVPDISISIKLPDINFDNYDFSNIEGWIWNEQ